MKTTFFLAIVIVISFIVITPTSVKDYPTPEVEIQEAANILTERKIDNRIKKIEYQFKLDSIHMKHYKNENQSKRR